MCGDDKNENGVQLFKSSFEIRHDLNKTIIIVKEMELKTEFINMTEFEF